MPIQGGTPPRVTSLKDIWAVTKCGCVNQQDPTTMDAFEIQTELADLLGHTDEEKLKKDPPEIPISQKCKPAKRKLLSIVVRKDKSGLFQDTIKRWANQDKITEGYFLKAFTKLPARGLWEGSAEDNVQIDVEFKDTPDNCISARILDLLQEYNYRAVGESNLYARTMAIELGILQEEES